MLPHYLRFCRHDLYADFAIGRGKLPAEIGPDDVHLRLGLLEGRSGTDAADDLEHARVAAFTQRWVDLVATEQEPEVDRLGIYREREITRRYAHDGVGLPAHRKLLTDGVGGAVQATLPQRVAQHDLPSLSALLVDAYGGPYQWPDTQLLEEVTGDDARTNPLRLCAGKCLLARAPSGQQFERAALFLPVTKIRIRRPLTHAPPRIERPHPDQSILVRIGQRA